MNPVKTSSKLKLSHPLFQRTKNGFDWHGLDYKRDIQSIDSRNFIGTAQMLCYGDYKGIVCTKMFRTGELNFLTYNNSPICYGNAGFDFNEK